MTTGLWGRRGVNPVVASGLGDWIGGSAMHSANIY